MYKPTFIVAFQFQTVSKALLACKTITYSMTFQYYYQPWLVQQNALVKKEVPTMELVSDFTLLQQQAGVILCIFLYIRLMDILDNVLCLDW